LPDVTHGLNDVVAPKEVRTPDPRDNWPLGPLYWYDTLAFGRFSDIEWDGGILDGKYGCIGRAFLAEVCGYGDAEAQQAIHDEIKRGGANAGLALSVRMVFDDARRTGRWNIAHKINKRPT
jgi:hypothetical protein